MFGIRRRRPADNDPTGRYLLDHDEHSHYRYPTDHRLPHGPANRGDELIWVAAQIERHAAAGTLDEGNPFVLDGEIAHRLTQWNAATDNEAAGRMRTAKALHAEESEHLVRLLEELRTVRRLRMVVAGENDHWRGVLHGASITPPPAGGDVDDNVAIAPASAGVILLDPLTATSRRPWAVPTRERAEPPQLRSAPEGTDHAQR